MPGSAPAYACRAGYWLKAQPHSGEEIWRTQQAAGRDPGPEIFAAVGGIPQGSTSRSPLNKDSTAKLRQHRNLGDTKMRSSAGMAGTAAIADSFPGIARIAAAPKDGRHAK